MQAPQIFRVAVFGNTQTQYWLLVEAFAASRKREFGYEPSADLKSEPPHLCVVDPADEEAMVRWAYFDPKGTLPAAFFGRVHQRAKNAVIVARPLTSGRIVESLDQLVRRLGTLALAA